MNRLEKLMHKERYLRNGAIQLNLLKYDIIWVTSRWGFIGKANVAEFFDFVAELFKEDKDVKEAAKLKKSKTKKTKEVLEAEHLEAKEEVKENVDEQSVAD